jgi:glutaredoxin
MITLYSKPLCPYCDSAENYLKNNNIKYCKVDISENAAAYEFVKSKGHKTVPQIYLEGKILVEGGYDGLKALLPTELEKRIQQHVNGIKDL